MKILFFYYRKLACLSFFSLAIPVMLSSCSGTDTVLVMSKTKIGPEPLVIQCKVYRKKEIGMVELKISGDWNASDKGNNVRFKDGREAEIKVVLIDSKGVEHKTGIYGESSSYNKGQTFEACFSDIDKKLRIDKVVISSSIEIECEKIAWHCYSPM